MNRFWELYRKLQEVVYNQFMARKRSLEGLLKDLRQQLPTLAERYGVETLEVFGSYVRAEQQADSDLDILVTFQEEPSLLTFIAIENYLSDELGVKVDLVMKDALKPAIGKIVLAESYQLDDIEWAVKQKSERA